MVWDPRDACRWIGAINTGQEGLIQIYAKQLRLSTVADCAAIMREATQRHWGHEEFLRAVLKREVEQRQDNQRKRRIKAAHFSQIKTMDTFDFRWLKNVEKAQNYKLATGRFMEEKQPVLMFGNPETGKTHLAIALAYQVCHLGYTTRFYTVANCDRPGGSRLARPVQQPTS